MSAHTPGPMVSYEKRNGIAVVVLTRTEYDKLVRDSAAAPEMLAALSMFVALDPRCHRGVTHCGQCAACRGSAAIAKAEGRTK